MTWRKVQRQVQPWLGQGVVGCRMLQATGLVTCIWHVARAEDNKYDCMWGDRYEILRNVYTYKATERHTLGPSARDRQWSSSHNGCKTALLSSSFVCSCHFQSGSSVLAPAGACARVAWVQRQNLPISWLDYRVLVIPCYTILDCIGLISWKSSLSNFHL